MYTHSKKLAETLQYFVDNPARRAFERKPNSDATGCFYSAASLNAPHEECKGCFVGILVANESLQQRMDQVDEVGIADILNYEDKEEYVLSGEGKSELGAIVLDLPPIFNEVELSTLERFQELHDSFAYWREEGLSSLGKAFLKQIVNTSIDLDEKDFEHFWYESNISSKNMLN
jgi:hypothetical protein